MIRLLLFTLISVQVWAFDGLTLSSKRVKNGESLLVQYDGKGLLKPLSMHVDKKKFPFFKHPLDKHIFYSLIPFHYNDSLGERRLNFSYESDGKIKTVFAGSIKLIWGGYKKEKLSVDSSKIKLSKRDEKRVEKEYYKAFKIYAKKSKQFLLKIPLIRPLNTLLTSYFGNERLFNGIRKSYHSGVDYRAKVGTGICAIGQGRVVLVQERFYAGLSVILDHGQGIFSCYYHLSKSLVKVGDRVKRKGLLGLSGATGRTTGPHLHFSMKLHGVTVNPLLLMKQLNDLLN